MPAAGNNSGKYFLDIQTVKSGAFYKRKNGGEKAACQTAA
jgi:hypothetical protein